MFLLEIIYTLAVIIVGFCVSGIIHELGHLVGGKLSGYEFDALTVSLFYIYKKDNALKFKIKKLTLFNLLSGHCAMIPNHDFIQYKPFWSNFTGPLSNLLTGFIFAIVMTKMEGESWLLSSLMIQLVIQNIGFGLWNLIPFRMFQQQSDGYNIIRGFYPTDRRSMYVWDTLDKEIKKGKRYSDFDPNLFLVNPDEKIINFWGAFLVINYAFYLADKGDHEAAMKEFNRFDFKLLFPDMRCEVKCEMLYYYLIYNFDAKKCQEFYEDEELKSYLKQNKVTPKRVLAAYTWIVLGEKNKGEQLLNEATTLAHALEGGYKTMELDSIEDFRLYQGTI